MVERLEKQSRLVEARRTVDMGTRIELSAMGPRLISRSQAKRVVARLETFSRAVLDFTAVDLVGQGFCDEVFRVFALAHPEIEIEPVGMNDNVAFMVGRARAAAARERGDR